MAHGFSRAALPCCWSGTPAGAGAGAGAYDGMLWPPTVDHGPDSVQAQKALSDRCRRYATSKPLRGLLVKNRDILLLVLLGLRNPSRPGKATSPPTAYHRQKLLQKIDCLP